MVLVKSEILVELWENLKNIVSFNVGKSCFCSKTFEKVYDSSFFSFKINYDPFLDSSFLNFYLSRIF
jgi:hypothetical protein